MKKLLAKTRKIVERDATDHAIFFRGFTSKMLQIFKHCRIAPSYYDSAKNRIAHSWQNDGHNLSATFLSGVWTTEQSGVLACIIRLDSFSVCFPLDGARSLARSLAARFFVPSTV